MLNRNYEAREIVDIQINELGHKLCIRVDGVVVLRAIAPIIDLIDDRKKIRKISLPEEYISADEAAEMLNLSKKVFTNLTNRGDIDGETTWDKKTVWNRAVIEKLAEQLKEGDL